MAKRVWTTEWSAYGGYDCMSSAWDVFADGKLVFELDERHGDPPTTPAEWRANGGHFNPRRPDPEFEALAAFVVEALNTAETKAQEAQNG